MYVTYDNQDSRKRTVFTIPAPSLLLSPSYGYLEFKDSIYYKPIFPDSVDPKFDFMAFRPALNR
jgi:hypothetical protein